MPDKPPDDRSPMAVGLEWSTRLMTIGLEMAIPIVGGTGSIGAWDIAAFRLPGGIARCCHRHMAVRSTS